MDDPKLINWTLGPLAASLAKAQTAFPPIPRDKVVKVNTKDGKSYTFAYAPLDTILAAVRKPLADNGLAIAQILDEGALVTMLLHESGASLMGRVPIPPTHDVQGFGSAITYLRRYAIQAVLGIAAEEDDDGNRSVGNTVRADVTHGEDASLIGTVEVGDKASSDFSLRQTPDGPALGFRLRGTRGGILVRCAGPLAIQLDAFREAAIGATVTCWGRVAEESFTPRGGSKAVTYQVLAAERVNVPEIGILPTQADPAPEAGNVTEAESEAIWSELERIGA